MALQTYYLSLVMHSKWKPNSMWYWITLIYDRDKPITTNPNTVKPWYKFVSILMAAQTTNVSYQVEFLLGWKNKVHLLVTQNCYWKMNNLYCYMAMWNSAKLMKLPPLCWHWQARLSPTQTVQSHWWHSLVLYSKSDIPIHPRFKPKKYFKPIKCARTGYFVLC